MWWSGERALAMYRMRPWVLVLMFLIAWPVSWAITRFGSAGGYVYVLAEPGLAVTINGDEPRHELPPRSDHPGLARYPFLLTHGAHQLEVAGGSSRHRFEVELGPRQGIVLWIVGRDDEGFWLEEDLVVE